MSRLLPGALYALICLSLPCMGATIAVPSYFYPGSLWDQLSSQSNTVGLAVINPDSGPGSSFDPNYLNQVKRSQAARLPIIGYVYTKWGARSSAQVKSDIDRYYSWYGVDGIFLDEASTDCGRSSYYSDLNKYVKAKGGKGITAINPGASTQECYMDAADIVINFEGSYSDYLNWNTTWESRYDASRFWHLVYSTPSLVEAKSVINLAKARGANWIYATDLGLPNPWGALPAYWSQEMAAVQATSVPATSPTADSVSPNAGTGLSQTFTFKYSSPNGLAYLARMVGMFNTNITTSGACYFQYYEPQNVMVLFGDDGANAAAAFVPGTPVTAQNSQCSIDSMRVTVSRSANTLTLSVPVTFYPSFSGTHNVYLLAQDINNAVSGWQNRGTWTH